MLPKKTFLLSIILLAIFNCSAQLAGLRTNWLWCDKTTEEGEDEIYFITNYRYSNGISNQAMLGDWNMNDGNQPRQIGNFWLWQGQLPEGTSVDITVFVMERDGGGSQQILGQARTVMNTLTPVACEAFPPSCPYAAAITGVVNFCASLPSFLQIQDTDDYIGSFTIRLSCFNHTLYTQGYNADRAVDFHGYPQNDYNLRSIYDGRFTGDGSNYNMEVAGTFIN